MLLTRTRSPGLASASTLFQGWDSSLLIVPSMSTPPRSGTASHALVLILVHELIRTRMCQLLVHEVVMKTLSDNRNAFHESNFHHS